MFGLKSIFERFSKPSESGEGGGDNSSYVNNSFKAKNWYEERYSLLTTQRNILFLILIILLCLAIVSVGAVVYIVNTKNFDPFVIQIDDATGMAKVVNPVSSSILSGNESLSKYFVKKYVTSRETYNPVDFATEARKTIRLLSTSGVYWNYLGYLRNNDVNPEIKYGQKNTTYLTVKSWSKLADKKYILRFSVRETSGSLQVFNKIAIVEFDYLPMELNDDERDVNPVGFQVIAYRVDDDNS